MKIEQVFTESDLSELEQTLVKSMSPTNCVMKWLRFWLKHVKAMRRWLLGCAIVLCVLCIFYIFELEKWWMSKWLVIICAIFGVYGLYRFFTWDKIVERIDNFLNPEKIVQKYREPFVVAVEENTLHYKQSDFPISSIDHIVEYKYFLFIRANKRWCFIKAEEEEKEMLLSKLSSNSNISFTKIEEPVDLRQFR